VPSLYLTLSTPVDGELAGAGRTDETKAVETVDQDRIEISELLVCGERAGRRGETLTTFTKETVDNDQEADGWSFQEVGSG